jgi:cilia- and flagella-associated protein 57
VSFFQQLKDAYKPLVPGKIAAIEHGLGECVDVMIPREQLIKLNSFVKNLELRIEQQSAEFQYQMQQSNTQHSEKMKEVHRDYCEAIEELKKRNDNMAARHVDELNILTANIAQEKDEHLKVLADVEAKFHQKIIAEYEKADSIKSQTYDMRTRYEDELKVREKLLVETRDSMAMDARKIDDDRQKLIKTLVCELEEKKKDFEEYCKQVECDHDRNLIELQLNYEKRLKDETETGVKAHSEANIMRQLQKTTLANYTDAKGEIATLQAQQVNFQKTIQGLQAEVESLKKELSTRDTTIRHRDLKIVEVEAERNEARKIADILQRKNDEIKHQIEPRDLEIRKHRQRILEMEAEQEQLEKTIKSMKVQLSEMKDKFVGTDMALKVERKRAQTARQHASLISSDIHKVSAHIQKPSKLKAGVRKLYQTYAEDSELKQQLLKKADINEEFSRQRAHLETIVTAKKKKTVKKKDDVDAAKLLRDNVELIGELNKLRSELQEVQKVKSQMESILNISGRVMKSQTAKEMLRKAVADTTELEERHKEECRKFEELIKAVTSENRTLKLKMAKLKIGD